MSTYVRNIADRAVRTFAQSAGALIVADGTGLLETDWLQVGSVAGMAAVLSALMTVAAGGLTGRDGEPHDVWPSED